MPFEVTIRMPHDHPAFPGHFPDDPIVPGVLILEQVQNALAIREERSVVVVGASIIKFVSPLRPGEELVISLEDNLENLVSFKCSSHGRTIASGTLEYQEEYPQILGGQ